MKKNNFDDIENVFKEGHWQISQVSEWEKISAKSNTDKICF